MHPTTSSKKTSSHQTDRTPFKLDNVESIVPIILEILKKIDHTNSSRPQESRSSWSLFQSNSVSVAPELSTTELVRLLRNRLSPQIFTHSPVGISICSANGQFIDSNETYKNMLGYSKDELIGQHYAQHFVEIDAENTKRELQEIGDQATIERFQAKMRRRDGTEFWAQMAISTILDASGQPSCLLTQMLDISEIMNDNKKLNELVKQRTQELIEKEALMRRAMKTNSHEMRTSVGTVFDVSKTLKKALTSWSPEQFEGSREEIVRSVDSIYASSRRLLNFLNDSLDYSALKEGQIQLQAESFSLRALLSDIFTSYHKRASKRSIGCEFIVPENIPSIVIGDQLRIRQILEKLLTNAVKHTPSGQISLSVALLPERPPGPDLAFYEELSTYKSEENSVAPTRNLSYETIAEAENELFLQFEITDTGEGIPRELLPRIFHPYEKGMNAELGTGLGLTIAKGLIEVMGGKILAVRSPVTDQGGTSFSFYIPLRKSSSSPKSMASSAALTLDQIKADLRARNIRVLMVDDTKTIRTMMKNQLGRAGITNVVFRENGKQAVDVLTSDPHFDLVLMDSQMPVMTGEEATKEIRQELKLVDLSIIGVSADGEGAQDRLDVGMDAFCPKPTSDEVLFRTIHRVIHEKSKKV